MSFKKLMMVVSLLAVWSCKPATQVTFDITTDVPCDDLKGTSITVGIEGQTERADPVQVTTTCRSDGTLGAIGTYVMVPKQLGVQQVAAAKVVAAVGEGVNVESDCTAAKQYVGCIVSRRRISFVASRNLTVPIQLYLICKDVRCDENTTCNKAGKCVVSEVDATRCDAQGVCTALTTQPDAGLPCLNKFGIDELFCSGDDAWCNVSMSGARSCGPAPVAGGVAFQCREANDCGPNLKCVLGADGVLGKCATTVQPGDEPLCTIGEMNSPCEGGPRNCNKDAGFGLTTCEPVIHPPAGALHCPREASLQCFGSTPYCSQFQEQPRCVADGGAQCWYTSDCPTGQRCFAGTGGQFSNICQPMATTSNPVPLCDPTKGDADCPTGYFCEGEFYGNTACVQKCWPGLSPSECLGTGRNGPLSIPESTMQMVNTFTGLVASVSPGASMVTVQSTAGIDAGTLLLLWQAAGMPPEPSQGNSNPVVLADSGVGVFEAARVQTVVSNTQLVLTKPLINRYFVPGAQVVTVPEYTDVNIALDGGVGFVPTFRAGNWDGRLGGIVAFLATGTVTNEGKISMKGSGFQGGTNAMSVVATGCTELDGDALAGGGAYKGRGFMETPIAQQAGHGRLANAGGGGNCQNGGGGGGSNGGAGGRGGATEDGFRNFGGWGGGPVVYDENYLALGGGAGGGQPHRQASSAGGTGGGVVLIAAGQLTGSGIIEAQGQSTTVVPDGADKWGSYSDSIGGGGGGGLIDIRTQGALRCGQLDARGGRGLANSVNAGGSGGGGGGGVIRVRQGDHGPVQCPADVSGGVSLPSGTGDPLLRGTNGGDGRLHRR